jgi:putative membrane protein
MSARHFYLSTAKERVASAIGTIEQHTSAEVMVSVRPRSGHYRQTDYLVGVACLMAGLLVFLFHPAPFREDLFPFEALVLFVFGTALSANVPDLRRWLTRPSVMKRAVATEARAAMMELGVTRTRRRTGLLVLVSLLERRVEVVLDVGLELLEKDPAFRQVVEGLERTLHPPDVERFVAALTALGPVLETHAPRDEEDVDELPNLPHTS